MVNNTFVHFTKCWNFRDGTYGEKDFYLNPYEPIRCLEPCYVKDGDLSIECTKLFYDDKDDRKFIILKGAPASFFSKCRESNTAVFVLTALSDAGITIKEFLRQVDEMRLKEVEHANSL